MDHDSERRAVDAAMSTADHKSLGNVLDVVRRLGELRSRGLSSAQIAERIRLTHPYRPDGGPWSPQAVERVLEIADGNRATTPGQTAMSPPAPPNRSRPTEAPQSHQYEENLAPLRVEPRRFHQRPADVDPMIDPDERRRWPVLVGLLTLVGLVAVGVGSYRLDAFDRFASTATSGGVESAGSRSTEVGSTAAETAADAARADDDAGVGQTAEPDDAVNAPNSGDGADSLTIRIEPSAPESDDGIAAATATVRTDGKLYVEGAFRTESEAQRFLESAAEVFGEAAIVPDYEIDSAAPEPDVSDVVLEKPVLFESGSAVIDPEYIPFLEACGDVLKLNSGIVMSVTAFTDASGSEEFNLELSQKRADAIVDFYRTLDVGDDQLISIGYGESDFVAGNETEEDRRRNRRAMLELLNVMNEG